MQYLYFDKEGNTLNLTRSTGENFLRGNIYFDITSTRVPSVQHIYIIDKDSNPVKVRVSFEDSDELSVFRGFGRDKSKIVDNVLEFNGQINIYAEYNQAGIYEDVLTIRDANTNVRLAVIKLEIELYNEEERFKDLLENLYNPELLPDLDIYYAFRESNIKEKNIDWKILNNKRKELLMLGHEIFPFIGADKALVNMINFLGYADSDVKEIWKNINEESPSYNKLKYIQNKYQAYKRGEKVSNTFEGSDSWKKTNRFGIFFKINKKEGGVDEFGLPIVVDNFEFTIDEILLKFKKVRDYLNRKFLPLNVKLHSITGEGLYFERIKVNTFNENVDIYDIKLDLNPEIKINNEDSVLFLEDLRKYNESYYELYNIDYTKQIITYKNKKIALSEETLAHKVFQDRIDVPVGARVFLEIGGLFNQVKDLQFTFNSILSAYPKIPDPSDPTKNLNSFGTWNFAKFGQNYECEWILRNRETNYIYRHKDFIHKNYIHTAIIPFEGIYDVELRVWDLDNKNSISIEQKAIEVRMYNPLLRYFRIRERLKRTLNEIPFVKLNRISGQLNDLFANNFTVSDFNVNIKTFDATSYLSDEKYKDYSADLLNFDRNTRAIQLTNINGDTSKISNTKIIAKHKQKFNIKEIPIDVVTDELMIIGNMGYMEKDTVIDAINKNKHLLVPLYEKTEILDYETEDGFDSETNEVLYYLLINDVQFTQRLKVEKDYYDSDAEETVFEEIYFNILDLEKITGTYEFKVKITEEVYNLLNEDFTALYNINNFYITEIIGYDEVNDKIIFKDPDNNRLTYLDFDNDDSISSVSEINGEESKIVFFDIITTDIEIPITTGSFNSNTNTLFVREVNKYNLLSTNVVFYWNRFDVNIIETRQNSFYDIQKYINSLSKNRTFVFSTNDEYRNTFFEINDERYNINDIDDSEVTEFLNSLDTPFYFIDDPINNGNIIGVKKLDNDYDTYLIKVYNGLLINNTYELKIETDFKRLFTFNNIQIFNRTNTIKPNIDTLFTVSETQVPGLLNTKTRILGQRGLIYETDKIYFTYNFKDEGYYNIELIFEDNNGNKNTKTLNNFINVTR